MTASTLQNPIATSKKAAVAKRWPAVAFWLRDKLDHEGYRASAAFPLSGASLIAIIFYEPMIYWPRYTSPLVDLLAEPWLLVITTGLALLVTLLLRGQYPPHPGPFVGTLGLLPLIGLLAVTDAQAAFAVKGRTSAPVPVSRPRFFLRRWAARLERFLGTRRGGPVAAAFLYAANLTWLFSAVAYTTRRDFHPESYFWRTLLLFGSLHLLAMAAGFLMVRHEIHQNALRRATTLPLLRTFPYWLLLPLPLCFVGVAVWSLPLRKKAPSLASLAFGTLSPLKRLRAFRDTHHHHNPQLELVQEPRRRQEENWLELHRFTLGLQAACVAGWLATYADMFLNYLGCGLFALGLLAFLSAALPKSLLGDRRSAILRLPGILFPLAFGTWAGLLATSPEYLCTLLDLLWISAVLMLCGLPGDFLGSHERLHRPPRSLIRALILATLGLSLVMAQQFATPETIVSGLGILFILSLGFSALLVHMAERRQAPELVRSPWLRYPFSLVLLPFRQASGR